MGFKLGLHRSTMLFFFCISVFVINGGKTKDERPDEHNAVREDENVNTTESTINYFKEAVKVVAESKLYDKLQEVFVHYVQHFLIYGKMTMLTKNGRITVPLNEKIQRNLTITVRGILHIEKTANELRNKDFDFSDPVNIFRLIRNNTVVLDKIVEHVNASFRAHKDVQNPEKIKFYNTVKNDTRFFKTEDLNRSMNKLIKMQRAASKGLSDVGTGELYGRRSHDLNSEECLDIGKHASSNDDIQSTIQFYEAAVQRLETYDYTFMNKSQILQTVIDFYSKYGEICENRVSKLQTELEKSLTETYKDETEDLDEESDDGKKNNNGDKENGKGGTENKRGGMKNNESNKGNNISEENEGINTRLEEEEQSDKSRKKENDEKMNSEKEQSVNTPEALNSEETNEQAIEKKDDSPSTEEFYTDLTGTTEVNNDSGDNKLDIDDELCIKEIINRFSKEVSFVHEEL